MFFAHCVTKFGDTTLSLSPLTLVTKIGCPILAVRRGGFLPQGWDPSDFTPPPRTGHDPNELQATSYEQKLEARSYFPSTAFRHRA